MKVISVCALFGFFLIWYLVTEVWKLAPETLLPSPLKALETGIGKWSIKKPDGSTLPQHIFASLRVSLLGFCFGAVIGVPLGILGDKLGEIEGQAITQQRLRRAEPEKHSHPPSLQGDTDVDEAEHKPLRHSAVESAVKKLMGNISSSRTEMAVAPA